MSYNTTVFSWPAQVLRSSGDSQCLPLDLLAEVLRHVEQSDRLTCCALVSKTWRQAATIATQWVAFYLDAEKGLDSLSAWLVSNKYANSIRCIKMCYDTTADHSEKTILQLPFLQLSHLRYLELQDCQLGPVATPLRTHAQATVVTSAAPPATVCAPAATQSQYAVPKLSSLGALTALTGLDLVRTCLDLDELGNCRDLQKLAFGDVGQIRFMADTTPIQTQQAAHATVLPAQIAHALPQLTQLTHLSLLYDQNSDSDEQQQLVSDIFASLSNLPLLQSVWLGFKTPGVQDLTHIPAQLTCLRLTSTPALTIETIPKLPQMRCLQDLHLGGAPSIDPSLFSSLTRLTHLSILCPDPPATVDEILTALQQLKHLKILQLPHCFMEDSPSFGLYAALTGSRELEELDLRACNIPQEALSFIFQSPSTTSNLTHLAMSSDLLGSKGVCQRLIACCPALRKMNIVDCGYFPDRPGLVDLQVSFLTAAGQYLAACTNSPSLAG